MKKLAVLCLMLTGLFALQSQAQTVNFGVTGGVNFNKVSFDKETFNTESEMGWFVGPKVEVAHKCGLAIDAAAYYNQRKLSLKKKGESEDFRSIEFPINLRYNIGLGSNFAVFFATGPQFGLNIGSKKWKIKDFSHSYETKTWNTSWNVGAGIRLMHHLEVGANYNFALGKYAESTKSDSYDIQVNALTLQATFFF